MAANPLLIRTEGMDPAAWALALETALAEAVTAGMRAGSVGLKGAMREQIRAAGLGTALGNAVRDKAFPEPPKVSARAVGEVRAYKSAARILRAFSQGPTIVPGGGRRALAIPTDKAPVGRYGVPLTPDEAKRRYGKRLQLIPLRGTGKARSALALVEPPPKGRRGAKPKVTILYWLVGSVTLARRLNPEAAAAEWTAELPGLVGQALARG